MLANLLVSAAVLAGATEIQLPQAVILEQSGKVTMRVGGKKSPAARGGRLMAGTELLVLDDAHVVLLYRDGVCSRVAGPAKVTIQSRPTRGRGRSAAFAGLTQPAFVSTVGGVRKVEQLEILSPRADGVTPRTFRLALRRTASGSRGVGGLTLADEVRVFGLRGDEQVFQLALPPAQADGVIRNIDLAQSRLASTTVDLLLEVHCLSDDEDDPGGEVLSTQRSRFTLASSEQQEALRRDLKEAAALAAREKLTASGRALLRYGCFVRHQFLGEAATEAALMVKKHPGDTFWREQLEPAASRVNSR